MRIVVAVKSMPRPLPTQRYRTLRKLLSGSLALLLAAGCETYDPSNPLIGRWTLTAPVGMGVALGTYEFRRSSMRALGLEQPVSYSISGNTVVIIPENIGPTLEVDLIDQNTARLKAPLIGSMMTLRRIHS